MLRDIFDFQRKDTSHFVRDKVVELPYSTSIHLSAKPLSRSIIRININDKK